MSCNYIRQANWVLAWYYLGMSYSRGRVALRTAVALRDLTHSLGPGSPFPSERDLATKLGVSRTTIRAAIKMLEAEGRVIRHGQIGRYIPENVPSSTGEHPSREERQARVIYESALIKDLAKSIKQEQYQALVQCLDTHISAIHDVPETEEGQSMLAAHNATFHKQLASFHDNSRAVSMLNLAIDQTSARHFRYLDKELMILHHKAIVRSLLLKDVLLTEGAMMLNLSYELDFS